MTAEAKITVVNKSSSIQTVTYTNWTDETSLAIQIPAGCTFVTYNYHEPDPDAPGTEIAVTENILNLPIEDGNPLTKILIQDFGYDKTKVSVTLTAGTYSA
jgi:hypothetical protein